VTCISCDEGHETFGDVTTGATTLRHRLPTNTALHDGSKVSARVELLCPEKKNKTKPSKSAGFESRHNYFLLLLHFLNVKTIKLRVSVRKRRSKLVNSKYDHLLTPWCRILFEKLIVTQLVKKYPAFVWNPKVHYRVHKSPPLDPTLSQAKPVRPIDPYLPKVHLNVILSPTPRSFQWSLAFGPPNQNPVNTFSVPHECHVSSPHHSPWFNHPNSIR
jgi:hypothetical protein